MDKVQNIIYLISSLLGLVLSLSTLVTLIVTKYSKSVEKIVQNIVNKALEKQKNNIESDINKSLEQINNKLQKMDEKDAVMMDATMNLARDRIHEAYRYHTSHNEIDAHSLYCIEELYKSYENLGGNSFVENEMKELRELPLKK